MTFLIILLAAAVDSGDETEHSWKSYDRRRTYWGDYVETVNSDCWEDEECDSLPRTLTGPNLVYVNNDDGTTDVFAENMFEEENAHSNVNVDDTVTSSSSQSLYPTAGGRLLWAPDPRQWHSYNLRATLAIHGLPPSELPVQEVQSGDNPESQPPVAGESYYPVGDLPH